ncbi:Aldehyde oxidase and xanthine dehydrogenase, molybdopterin binding domain protein, partial [mine drainage metagenome]
ADTGAYGGHGLTVAQAAGHKTLCLYRASAYHFVADAVYTNSPVSGAMRGYGAPQGYFALESHMDEIAATLGLDPLSCGAATMSAGATTTPSIWTSPPGCRARGGTSAPAACQSA